MQTLLMEPIPSTEESLYSSLKREKGGRPSTKSTCLFFTILMKYRYMCTVEKNSVTWRSTVYLLMLLLSFLLSGLKTYI